MTDNNRTRKKPHRTFMNTEYGTLLEERYRDFKDGYNKAFNKAINCIKQCAVMRDSFANEEEMVDYFLNLMEK